ncbi:MAG: hypothetical protein ACM3MG_00445 [Bacillota bacterium]
MKFIFLFLYFICCFFIDATSYALPAFARRENVSCTMCHVNGSAPRLTEFGYMYRRAGFRNPWDIGKIEKDNEAARITDHMSAQIVLQYLYGTSKEPGASSEVVNDNFDIPTVSVFPVVGAFNGNFSAWSAIDAVAKPSEEGVSLSDADLRYVIGDQHLFYNFRAGLIGYQGYGLADRGLLGGGDIPLINSTSPYYNQDALFTPFGDSNQLGAEAGVNYQHSHFTIGIYNGFDGTTLNAGTPELNPAIYSSSTKGHKDIKAQLDQFIGSQFEATFVYYNGAATILDPSNTVPWRNNYDAWRLYLAYSAIPSVLDLNAGFGYDTYHWVNSGSTDVEGTGIKNGSSLEALYYGVPSLTLEARWDYVRYNQGADVKGVQFLINFPRENNIFIIGFNNVNSDIAESTAQYFAKWNFLF